jgi:hypothetical protein
MFIRKLMFQSHPTQASIDHFKTYARRFESHWRTNRSSVRSQKCRSNGPDFLSTASQIIASNSFKWKHQGAAGSLIGTVVSYRLSAGLKFSGTIKVYTSDNSKNPIQGYQNALYLGIGMAGFAAVIALAFVRILKNRREGWGEDDKR